MIKTPIKLEGFFSAVSCTSRRDMSVHAFQNLSGGHFLFCGKEAKETDVSRSRRSKVRLLLFTFRRPIQSCINTAFGKEIIDRILNRFRIINFTE